MADRRWKPEAYGEAGIDVFWRVELEAEDGPEVTAYARSGGEWVELSCITARETGTIEVPFSVRLTPLALVGPRRP
jgi:hypothetical protein